MTDCVFCRIVARQTAADIEYEDDHVLAFKDIYPKAPVHILIVPKRHIASIAQLSDGDADLIGRCVLAARRLGETKGFAEKGYRISVNTGPLHGRTPARRRCLGLRFQRESCVGPRSETALKDAHVSKSELS